MSPIIGGPTQAEHSMSPTRGDAAITPLHALIADAPMSRAQVLAVLLLAAISALDGFDVLAVTFAAPGFVPAFGIDKALLGWVLSMGLIGMGLGSLLIAPLADVFGRRRLLLAGLGLMAVGMFLSAAAHGVAALMIWRLLTGLGIGSMVAVIVPLTAEYANTRRRELCIGLMLVGYPLGGTVGGSVAALLLHAFGWRSVFVLGGIAALVLVLLTVLWLPESISFLLNRRADGALARINRVLASFGRSPVSALPEPPQTTPTTPLSALFAGGMRRRTLRLTLINFLFIIAVYYFLSWLPAMVVGAGYTAPTAVGVAVLANLAGVVGGLLLGWAAPTLGLRTVSVIALFGTGLGIALFGSAGANLALLRLTAAFTGFFMIAGIVGVYAIIARSFPAQVRASGAGFVIGIGRGGSALAPIIAGLLFAAGMGNASVSWMLGAGAILASVALLAYRMPDPT